MGSLNSKRSWMFCLLALIFVQLGNARQHYRARIPNGDAIPCPSGDPNCEEGELCEGIGHESCAGGAVTPKLNPFGQDLHAAGVKWTKELCEMDSDGDGFSNGHEVGDPCCIWKEGATSPQWMLDWPVSHPGVPHSKQTSDENIEELCRSQVPLETAKFYNEGEEQITLDFPIDTQTIPPQETTYVDYRMNLPDEGPYYVVGAEALLDNEEMVHHFGGGACTTTVDKPGVIPNLTMNFDCQESLFIWAPGAEPFVLPSNAAIPIGKGTGRLGLFLQMHYDNPLFKEGQTDATGLRLHVTTKPRQYEVDFLSAGTVLGTGRIPPKKKTFSATYAQVKVDKELAPDGVHVFSFFPHMHLTGRRIFTEKFTVPLGDTTMDFSNFQKDGDIARDDKWSFYGQRFERISPVKVHDGDILATTCMYNSEDRDDVTLGGLGSRDEMCVNFLAYYPGGAIEIAIQKGPSFFGELSDEEFKSIQSFTDLPVGTTATAFPTWREAYLSGDLECDDSTIEGGALEQNNESLKDMQKDLEEACGKEMTPILVMQVNDKEDMDCSLECAKVLYNMMGCHLVKHAMKDGEITHPLIAQGMEQAAETHCGKTFLSYYNGDGSDKNAGQLGRRLLDRH